MGGKKSKVMSPNAKAQVMQRLKEGYTKEDIVKAITNASKDTHHKDSNYKYLTIEFITRSDRFERFVTMGDFKIKTVIIWLLY